MSRVLIGVLAVVVSTGCGVGAPAATARVRSSLGADTAQFNFEGGQQAWTKTGAKISSLALTTSPVFLGNQALRVNIAAANKSGGAQYVSVDTTADLAGSAVTFHVFVPAGCALASVQAFTDDAAPNPRRWNGARFPASALTFDGWNELVVAVPAGAAQVQSMGVEFVFSGPWTGAITLDSIGWPEPPAAADGGGGGPDGGVTGTLRVMPLGDSITEGVNGGYRNVLWDKLTGHACSLDYVGSVYDPYAYCPDKDHEGHPGYTIGGIAAEVDGWLGAKDPNFVLLMIGTNDIAWWCATTPAQLGVDHDRLVGQILARTPNAWVLVASIPPITSQRIKPNNWDRAQLGRELNAEIKKHADERAASGQRVRFVDVYSVLTLQDLYDGVHPTLEAHGKIAGAWYDVMVPQLDCQK